MAENIGEFMTPPTLRQPPQPRTHACRRDTVSLHPLSNNSPASLPDLGPAPELTNDIWLNVAQAAPLRLADLRGKVVAIDMWTFG